MNKPVQTKTFASGNSVAVRLPDDFDIPAGADVEVSRSGDRVVITVLGNKAEAKRRMHEMLEKLKSLPKPPYIQEREPFEFPDREGL